MKFFNKIRHWFKKPVLKVSEIKDCEHGFHDWDRDNKVYDGFDFPTSEHIVKCKTCGIYQYQLCDSYMGGVIEEIIDYDINIDEIRIKRGINSTREDIEKEYSTQEGRDKRYNTRRAGFTW